MGGCLNTRLKAHATYLLFRQSRGVTLGHCTGKSLSCLSRHAGEVPEQGRKRAIHHRVGLNPGHNAASLTDANRQAIGLLLALHADHETPERQMPMKPQYQGWYFVALRVMR